MQTGTWWSASAMNVQKMQVQPIWRGLSERLLDKVDHLQKKSLKPKGAKDNDCENGKAPWTIE